MHVPGTIYLFKTEILFLVKKNCVSLSSTYHPVTLTFSTYKKKVRGSDIIGDSGGAKLKKFPHYFILFICCCFFMLDRVRKS